MFVFTDSDLSVRTRGHGSFCSNKLTVHVCCWTATWCSTPQHFDINHGALGCNSSQNNATCTHFMKALPRNGPALLWKWCCLSFQREDLEAITVWVKKKEIKGIDVAVWLPLLFDLEVMWRGINFLITCWPSLLSHSVSIRLLCRYRYGKQHPSS